METMQNDESVAGTTCLGVLMGDALTLEGLYDELSDMSVRQEHARELALVSDLYRVFDRRVQDCLLRPVGTIRGKSELADACGVFIDRVLARSGTQPMVEDMLAHVLDQCATGYLTTSSSMKDSLAPDDTVADMRSAVKLWLFHLEFATALADATRVVTGRMPACRERDLTVRSLLQLALNACHEGMRTYHSRDGGNYESDGAFLSRNVNDILADINRQLGALQ